MPKERLEAGLSGLEVELGLCRKGGRESDPTREMTGWAGLGPTQPNSFDIFLTLGQNPWVEIIIFRQKYLIINKIAKYIFFKIFFSWTFLTITCYF